MKKNFYTLGIESSCDETSISVFKNDSKLLSNVVYSQIEIHKKFGGVVPEVASRNHLEKINFVFENALKKAKIKASEISLIAVSNTPGLIGSLIIGASFAKALSLTLNIPLITVNHIKGHLFSSFINKKLTEIKYPFLGVVISGGHTQIFTLKSSKNIKVIGETKDDAIGEAFDKVARVLGLPYPGGINLEKLALKGDKNKYDFKVGLEDDLSTLNLSFSGIKTGVINRLNSFKQKKIKYKKEDIAASFQECAFRALIKKINMAVKISKLKNVSIGGGVSNNMYFRKMILKSAKKNNYNVVFPKRIYTQDNAAMISLVGYLDYKINNRRTNLNFDCYSKSIKSF